jgi:hypothetical protein
MMESATWWRTGLLFRRGEIAHGAGEEVDGGLLLEGRGVRHVHDHVRALEDLREALPGEGVDARAGRGRHGLVAAVLEQVHHLRPDPARTSDDDDLHRCLPFLFGVSFSRTGQRRDL